MYIFSNNFQKQIDKLLEDKHILVLFEMVNIDPSIQHITLPNSGTDVDCGGAQCNLITITIIMKEYHEIELNKLRQIESLILSNLDETNDNSHSNCNSSFKVDWIENEDCKNFNWTPSFSYDYKDCDNIFNLCPYKSGPHEYIENKQSICDMSRVDYNLLERNPIRCSASNKPCTLYSNPCGSPITESILLTHHGRRIIGNLIHSSLNCGLRFKILKGYGFEPVTKFKIRRKDIEGYSWGQNLRLNLREFDIDGNSDYIFRIGPVNSNLESDGFGNYYKVLPNDRNWQTMTLEYGRGTGRIIDSDRGGFTLIGSG